MISNHSNVNFENRKKNRVNKMTISNSIHLQIILHYITFTDYYIVKDIFRLTSIHSNVNVEINKNNRVNKMTILKSIHLQIILHYIIPTNYYVVKDTLR